MNLSNLIINALLKEAQAKEAKAIVILQNYFDNSAGIGEHPDIVEECSKQLKELADAREAIKLLNQLTQTTVNTTQAGENTDGQ